MISVLRTDADLEALGPEWEALWSRTPAATPFQSPHWLLPWWRQFGTGQPRVAIARREGRLTGVMPLYILADEHKALPIGVGATDYFDLLGEHEGLLENALQVIAGDNVVSCDLVDLWPYSPLVGTSAPGWRAEWQVGSACPVLALPYIAKPARRKLTMNRNRADRAGGWEVTAANPTTVASHVETLIRLHQSRWTAQGEAGVMADPRIVAFWRGASPGLVRSGLLRINTLLVGGEAAAVIAALISPERIFFYLSGFDAAHSFVSPGTILLGAMLEEAIAEGRSEAHFLRGREAYKYVWGATDRYNWSGRLHQ